MSRADKIRNLKIRLSGIEFDIRCLRVLSNEKNKKHIKALEDACARLRADILLEENGQDGLNYDKGWQNNRLVTK